MFSTILNVITSILSLGLYIIYIIIYIYYISLFLKSEIQGYETVPM